MDESRAVDAATPDVGGEALHGVGVKARSLSIAGVDPERRFAGGESQVLGLSKELIRAGHRVDLICDPAGVLWERARVSGVACYPLRIRNSVDAPAGLRLRRLLAQTHYDVVHFHTARAHALAPFAQGRARALIVTRRMDYAPNRIFAPWLFNRAVDGVAAISPAVADALVRSGVARDHIAIIPSGVDCDRFRPPVAAEREAARAELGLTPGDIAIGTVGMLEPRKGHRVLVDAMALLRGAAGCSGSSAGASRTPGQRLRCFIAGGGTLADELAGQINRNHLEDSTRMMGTIADSRALLWALDIFAMPSLQEGLGIAALEAMACGLPVVASAAGGLADAVADGATGIHVPAADARPLADALALLAAEPETRAAMGAAGRRRACANYDMEAMAQRTLELYRACLANRAGSRGE